MYEHSPQQIKDMMFPLVQDGLTNLQKQEELYITRGVELNPPAIRVMRGVILKALYPSLHPYLDVPQYPSTIPSNKQMVVI